MAFDYTDCARSTPLIQAIVSKDPEGVINALKQGFNANLPNNRGWTPLHVAADGDARISCLQALLNHKSANINAQTFEGETPLFIACKNNSLQTAEVLLNNPKCNVNLSNEEKISPLHIACSTGNERTVKLLINFGHNVNAADFNGYTPLHEVISPDSLGFDNHDIIALNICKYLIDHGADPDIAEDEGNFPFHLACQSGLSKTADFLLSVSKQSDLINLVNCDGRSPLMLAITSKNLPMIKTLLSHGANPNVADHSDITPLHLAAHSANYEMFDIIHKATSKECILKYCTFDELSPFTYNLNTATPTTSRHLNYLSPQAMLNSSKIIVNSVICLAIDTEDLPFLQKVLESGLDEDVLNCPTVHSENRDTHTYTLHTPVSFLLESKMSDLGERTLDFLNLLIKMDCPVMKESPSLLFDYVDPICAAFVALNDCSTGLVLKCLEVLLKRGADPDKPHNRMPFSIEQACMRGCADALPLLLKYTNALEPEDILTWIEAETSDGQLEIVRKLLPAAPYYRPTARLLPDIPDGPDRESILAPKVFSLASHCRTVVRRQLRLESSSCPTTFKESLVELELPNSIHSFLRYC